MQHRSREASASPRPRRLGLVVDARGGFEAFCDLRHCGFVGRVRGACARNARTTSCVARGRCRQMLGPGAARLARPRACDPPRPAAPSPGRARHRERRPVRRDTSATRALLPEFGGSTKQSGRSAAVPAPSSRCLQGGHIAVVYLQPHAARKAQGEASVARHMCRWRDVMQFWGEFCDCQFTAMLKELIEAGDESLPTTAGSLQVGV